MGRFPVNEMNVVKIILITNTSHPRAKDVTVWILPLTDLILRETKEDMTRVVCILPSLKQSNTKTLRCPYMNYESPCWPLCGPSIAMPESWAQLRFSPHVNCKERSAGSLQKASFTIMWYRLLHPPQPHKRDKAPSTSLGNWRFQAIASSPLTTFVSSPLV